MDIKKYLVLFFIIIFASPYAFALEPVVVNADVQANEVKPTSVPNTPPADETPYLTNDGPLSEATVEDEENASGERAVILAQKKGGKTKPPKTLPPLGLPPDIPRVKDIVDGTGLSTGVIVYEPGKPPRRARPGTDPLDGEIHIRIVEGPDGIFLIELVLGDGRVVRVGKGELKITKDPKTGVDVVTGIETDEKLDGWKPEDWGLPKEPKRPGRQILR